MTSGRALRFASLLVVLAACGDSELVDAPDPVCGNGIEEGTEQCDDGNTAGGDGCSATCQDEGIGAQCGNGVLDSGEACDDRNFDDGDGCTNCQIDSGYTCSGTPSVCTNSLCGNGAIDDGETCDDMNFVGDDGCSACQTDVGWTCTGAPSTCTRDIPAGGEGTCEAPYVVTLTPDTNGVLRGRAMGTTAGGTSQVPGSQCGSFPTSGQGPDQIFMFTVPVASNVTIFADNPAFDIVIRVTEDPCDVMTQIPHDLPTTGLGCVDVTGDELIGYNDMPPGTYYVVLDGYSSTTSGLFDVAFTVSPVPVCGNGNVEPGEDCDAGTGTVEGCSAACVAAPGFVCTGSPSVCAETCGDGVLDPNEACDDDDLDNGDGCSDNCKIEEGFMCSGTPSVCEVAACNDGDFVSTEEECDDQNQTAGDGCSLTCSLEYDVLEAEINDFAPQTLSYTLVGGNAHIVVKGSFVEDDVDLYEFTLDAPSIVSLETYNAIDGDDTDYTGDGTFEYFDCINGIDTVLHVHAEGDDYDDSGEAIFYDDDGGGAFCSYIGPNGFDDTEGYLQPGTYVIRVTNYDDEAPLYMLDIRIESEASTPTTDLVINEVFVNPGTMADSNCDGAFSTANDEFIELVNKGTTVIDLTGMTISDNSGAVRHTFAAGTTGSMMLDPGKAVVVWGGGAPACPGVTNWFKASTNSLGLSNDEAERITVRDGSTVMASTQLPLATVGVSQNLNPDTTGTMHVNHDTVPTAGTRKFSPGRKVDGTAF